MNLTETFLLLPSSGGIFSYETNNLQSNLTGTEYAAQTYKKKDKKLMFTTETNRFYHDYPVVAALIGVRYQEKDNFIAVVWHSPVSFEPPLYGISVSSKRFSHNMILNAGHFTVNFLPFSEAHLIHQCGHCSGQDTDKTTAFSLKTMAGETVASPWLNEAYAAFECTVFSHQLSGDHTWITGQISGIHFKDDAFKNNTLDFVNYPPALYIGNNQYTTADKNVLFSMNERKP